MNIREISDVFKDTTSEISALKSYNFGWASDRVRQGNTEDFQELNEFPRVFFAVPTITGSDQTRKQDTYQVTLFFDDLLGYDNEGDEDPTLQIDKWANLQQYANYFVQRLNKIKQSILPNYLFIPEAPTITFDSFTGLQRMITVQLSFNLVVPTNCDPGIITLVQCIANIVTSSNLTASLMTVLKFAASLEGRATVTADINFVQKAEASLLTSAIVTGNITIPKTFNASLLATGTTTADLTVVAAASLLLDLYPNAAAAYSLRKLRTAYTGSAVRVRRSSDNTEQDIGFVAGQLDTASLLAFCGAGNGFVTSWYDQSGDARDAAQTTQANQPQIVSSGSLILENGKVSISYDGTNDTLISSNYNFGTTSYSSFVVSRSGGLNSSGRAIYTIKTITPSENGYFHLVFRNNISNNFRSYYSSDGASLNFLIQTPLNVFPTTQNLISNIVPTSGNITFNLNSIQQDSDLAIGQTLNNTIFLIGNYYAGLIESENFFHQGTISELIIYMSNEQSNRTGVETNINTHYEIY
jgi:hypothetical protein